MNKNGNIGSIFAILVPVFFIITLVIFDTIFSISQEKSYKAFTEDMMRNILCDEDIYYEDYYEVVKYKYESNGYDTDFLIVDADEGTLKIENEHVYFGVFSSLSKIGKEVEVKLFNLDFLRVKVKKNSRFSIKVLATFDENNNVMFEYTEE